MSIPEVKPGIETTPTTLATMTSPTTTAAAEASRALVEQGYDRCSAAYTTTRSQDSARELTLLTSSLPRGATILDLGCGAGVPVALHLATHGYRVTGVDISSEQVKRAQENVPAASTGATFLQADMASPSLAFPLGSFDAVVAFFSIFHLPRALHADMFRRIATWLKPGGYLLATAVVSAEGGEGHVENFFGARMYWSNHGLDEYRAILAEAGFEVLENRAEGASGESEVFEAASSAVDKGKQQHPLLFARKRERVSQ